MCKDGLCIMLLPEVGKTSTSMNIQDFTRQSIMFFFSIIVIWIMERLGGLM